jgi:hypothetical protein
VGGGFADVFCKGWKPEGRGHGGGAVEGVDGVDFEGETGDCFDLR